MSNQIETQIDVSLTERNRLTALFRIILIVPAFIFVSSFAPATAFSDDALGIFGFSFLEENAGIIHGAKINDTSPSFDNITKGKYAVSRPLFIYFKKEHLDL
jgi:hypothetical protein